MAYHMRQLQSGNDPALLSEVRGINWGAASFSWLWAFAHRLPFLGAILLLTNLLWSLVPWTLALSLAGELYLAARGNELAWRRRSFASLEEFRETERAWGEKLLVGFLFFQEGTAMAGIAIGWVLAVVWFALAILYDAAGGLLQ